MGVIVIKLAEVIGSPLCIAADDGDKVFHAIQEAYDRGEQVSLSFEGVEDLTSAFLNAAVGQLYGSYPEAVLREFMLPPISISPEDLGLLIRVIGRAKEYAREPKRFDQAEKEVLGDDE